MPPSWPRSSSPTSWAGERLSTPEASERETLIRTRRDLHRHPELAYQEHRTAALAAERLRAAGYEVRTGIAETGVIGTLRGSGPGRTLLLRADMDALPVGEETTHDFRSTVEGRMHACGHDAHVAIGLAVAERLARRRAEWSGTVRYVFQPAEEGGGGAARMIAEGATEGVDAALGLHVWLGLPSGVVGVAPGPFMAGSSEFELEVRGRGGHGAIPQETRDPVLAASQIVVALQSIVARRISPLETGVVTVARFHAGTAANVIPDEARLEGTIRAFDPEVFVFLKGEVERVVRGISAAGGVESTIRWREDEYPPTVNDPAVAELVRRAAVGVVGEERVRWGDAVRTMAAEDFAEFLLRVPGCYFFVGAENAAIDAVHPHHNSRFDLCEEALPVAVEVLERAALEVLLSS
jgi:amidohydrolase